VTTLNQHLRTLPSSFLLTSLTLLGSPAVALAQDSPAHVVDEGEGSRYGRIRHLEGELLLQGEQGQRSGDLLGVNSPVLPGDQVITGNGRVEIQLPDGSLVRVDRNSRLETAVLADLSNRLENRTWLLLAAGRTYLHVERIESAEDVFRVDTPAASVYFLTQGVFRVDTDPEDGRTIVASHSGVAEVVSEGISVLVRSGEKTDVQSSHAPSTPRTFNHFHQDDFDRWNRERQAAFVKPYEHLPAREVPAEVEPYVTELAYYGDWIDDPGYGWVWTPATVASSWSPYRTGRWSAPSAGWIWVSSEPWGWAPYHYGRWQLTARYGWVWIPGSVFGGAWVSWADGPGHVAWCPLDYYNRPALYPGNQRDDRRAIDRAHDAWTIVHKGMATNPRVQQVALSRSQAEPVLASSALRDGPPAKSGLRSALATEPAQVRTGTRRPAAPVGSDLVSFRTLEGRGRIRTDPRALHRRDAAPNPTTSPNRVNVRANAWSPEVPGTIVISSPSRTIRSTGPRGGTRSIQPTPSTRRTSPDPTSRRAYVAPTPSPSASGTTPSRVRVIQRNDRATILNRILQGRKTTSTPKTVSPGMAGKPTPTTGRSAARAPLRTKPPTRTGASPRKPAPTPEPKQPSGQKKKN
jgi:hypothetical protein